MFGIEFAGCLRFAFDVEAEISFAYQNGVETKVDVFVLGRRIVAGEGVEYELQVEWVAGRFFT